MKIDWIKFCITIIIFVCAFSNNGFTQRIFSVKYPSQADVKVFVVDYISQADLAVFKVGYQSQATDNSGKWYFVNYASQADKQI